MHLRKSRVCTPALIAALFASLATVACDDNETPGGSSMNTQTGALDCTMVPPGQPLAIAGSVPKQPEAAPQSCTPLDTDYAVNINNSTWGSCVTDTPGSTTGQYPQIGTSPSTVNRVAAFERIASILFSPVADPNNCQFLEARQIYQEEEGIDSRVVRRYDPRFPKPAMGGCRDAGVPEMYPDYCVGPAKLQPIILCAFNGGLCATDPSACPEDYDQTCPGQRDDKPRVHAARIEAALLWFSFSSAYKESLTCVTEAARDCDSSNSYVTGSDYNMPRNASQGLARYINEVDPAAMTRAWDGILAYRCAREKDRQPDGTFPLLPQPTPLMDLGRNQYDRALLDGLAAIVRDRLLRFQIATGDEQAYYWAFVQVLGRALDHDMTLRNAGQATVLRDELAKTDPASVNVQAAVSAIEAVFTCP